MGYVACKHSYFDNALYNKKHINNNFNQWQKKYKFQSYSAHFMSIINTLLLFWISYTLFRLSFRATWKKEQYGAIWTCRLAGSMGLLMALESVMVYFDITEKKLFNDFQDSIFLIAIAIVLFGLYIDMHILRKAGQKLFAIESEKRLFMYFTWDIWLVTIATFVTAYILRT